MMVTCSECGGRYDDAKRCTFCPHMPFITDEHCAQKDLAFSLVGKDVHFNHQPEGPYHRIQSIDNFGMVTLRDMGGEFAPHLFKVRAPSNG